MNTKLKIFENLKINFFLKSLFYTFPIILIFPSGYITGHVTLLTVSCLIFFYKNNLKIKIILIDYLIFLLFFLSIFSTLKNISTLGNIIFIKSILDVRFAIFFLIIRNILANKIVNLKLLSIISLTSSIFLSLDIFLQHLIGHDIFNFQPFDGRYNGFFEHEAIAGSYIQKFFLISLLSIFLLSYKKVTKIFFITSVIIILGLGILLSLDRMPFLIFFFIIFLLFVFMKNYRILFFSNIIILSILFIFLINNYDVVKKRYEYFNRDINFSAILNIPLVKNNAAIFEDRNNELPKNQKLFYGDYYKIYNAAYLVFSKNYLIGSGVKSFMYECTKIPHEIEYISCNNHPHNIYLEILVNLGIIGMSIFIIFLFFLIKKIIKNLFVDNQSISLILFLTIFIAELIPLRSYGSIFQTNNGSIFWFLLALISYINDNSVKKSTN
jgi:O-antigen ligase